MKNPNILFVMADDMGYWSMGCAGNKEVQTPNLDRLAEEGMYFPEYFCTSPVCSPARASVLCGKMPSGHGVLDWISKGHINYEDVASDLRKAHQDPRAPWEYAWSKQQLEGDEAIRYMEGLRTYTDILAEHGYICGLAGKWHLGDAGCPQHGFSYWEPLAMGGDNYFYPVVLRDGKFDMLRHTYITNYITDKALDFLRNRDTEKPFYLSVHYTAPHSPWERNQHPEEFYDLYQDCPFVETPNVPPHKWGHAYSQEERRKRLQGYYAAVTAMDSDIGKLVGYLKKEGLWDDTIVIFTADNGMSMGHHGIFGKGNGTFPLNMYDTAVRVPMIVTYPRGIRGGCVAKGLYSHYDLMPTIAGLMGEAPEEGCPGQSFQEIFQGEVPDGRDAVVVYDEYGPVRMIRTEEYKYIHRYPYGENEFYNLKADPGEESNLALSKDPAVLKTIAALRSRMEQWFVQYSDPDKDGTKQAVCGLGQIDLVGRAGEGREAFVGQEG